MTMTMTRVVADVIKVQALQVCFGEYPSVFKISQDCVITVGELINEGGELAHRRIRASLRLMLHPL
jgi:hypothetical protein